jgi:hypothetical protein
MKKHVPRSCHDLTYIAEVEDVESWSLEDLIVAIMDAKSFKARGAGQTDDYYAIVGCIAGGDAGVDMASMLSERFEVLSNGAQGDFKNRRNKKVQVSGGW